MFLFNIPENRSWFAVFRTYLCASAAANAVWEVSQLPLYTIWTTGTWREIAFAVLHCTTGDVMIAALSLLTALMLVGSQRWPSEGRRPVVISTIVIGLAYTAFSEWLNVKVRANWAYSDLMPVVPIIGTGLAPLLQWLVVPGLALRIALAGISPASIFQKTRG